MTFYKWKSKFEGMESAKCVGCVCWKRRNGRLKRIVAQQALDIDALKAVLSKKW